TVDTTAEEPETVVPEDAADDQPIPSPAPLTPPSQQPQDEALDACAALARRVEHLEQDKVAQDIEIIKLVGTSHRVDTSDDTLMKDVSNQGREFNRAEDAVKETEEVREYTADTQVKGRQADIYHIDMDHAVKVLSMQEDESEVQEAVEVVTTAKLITEVVVAVSEIVSAAAVIPSAVHETISAAAIPTVTAPSIKVVAPVKAVVPSTRRKRGVVSGIKRRNHLQKLLLKPPPRTREKLQEEFNQDIDWEAAIDHVKQKAKEEPFIQRYQVMRKRPQTEAQARQNMMMYLKNTDGFTLDFFKGMSYDDIRPIFEIVPDEDDDVFTEATPLARKVPVLDYQVILVNNKPRYKVIKADDTHQLYASFITMLKNFDREDLETLWRIVKERFLTSKPNNFSDEYLLTALKTMFERPDGQDNIIMLVERRYPLMKFTLEQMLNVVRLQVEEESEMSLELIRFTKQQLQEAHHN
nr:hypothetical protein [Tanacetum cinerariifolium]